MIGGYINCINGIWKPINNQEYNRIEASGLNELGICFDGEGTDKYDLNSNGKKLWYLKNKNKNKYTLIDIIDEIKKQNLKNLNYNTKNKIENKIKPAYNILFDAYNMREKKSYEYEKKDGKITNSTKKHQEYYNKLYNFLLHLENESDYIDKRIKIANRSRTRSRTRTRTRSKSSSRNRTRNRTRSRSRS